MIKVLQQVSTHATFSAPWYKRIRGSSYYDQASGQTQPKALDGRIILLESTEVRTCPRLRTVTCSRKDIQNRKEWWVYPLLRFDRRSYLGRGLDVGECADSQD